MPGATPLLLDSLVDKMTMSQQYALVRKQAKILLDYTKKCHWQVKGGDPSYLLSTDEMHLGCCV